MRVGLAILPVVFLLLISTSPLAAHHSVKSEFDSSRAMSITGMITRIEWTNPHVWIYLNVKDADGRTVPWRVELAATGALTRAGFEKTVLDFEKPVTIQVWPAFQDPHDGRAGDGRLLTLQDGRSFDVSDKWPDHAIPVK
jgi:hypothetical protein